MYIKLRDMPPAIYTRSSGLLLCDFSTDGESSGNGAQGINNIFDYLEAQLSKMPIGHLVGKEVKTKIGDIVEDSYGQFENIIYELSDFVDISNNKTFIETNEKFKAVIRKTVIASLKIAVKAAALNVTETCRSASVHSVGSMLHNIDSTIKTGYPTGVENTTTSLNSDKVVQGGYTPTHLSEYGTADDYEVPSFDLKISQEIGRMVYNGEAAATSAINGSSVPNEMMTPLHTPTKTAISPGSADKYSSSISPTSGTRVTNQYAIMIINESENEDRKRRTYIVENPPSYLLKQPRKHAIKPAKKLMSPFATKQPALERLDSTVADALYSYIMSISEEASLDKIWLQSSHPFKISLRLRDLQDTIKMGGQMDSDCLNLAIRVLYQNEVDRFRNTNYLGWRHFINQDFGMYALAGEEFWEPHHQLAHFIGSEVQYLVSESHLILLPVHFFKHYALYAFDMENKKLSVLDSLNTEGPLGEPRCARHAKIRLIVSHCLMECMRLSFPGWDEDMLGWDFETVMTIPEQRNGDDCGFFAFNFMENWDGRKLVNPITEDSYDLRKQFMLHLLLMKDNEVSLPESVLHHLRRLRG